MGFLDGETLEQFMHLKMLEIESVIEGGSHAEHLVLPIEDMQRVLERLHSLH